MAWWYCSIIADNWQDKSTKCFSIMFIYVYRYFVVYLCSLEEDCAVTICQLVVHGCLSINRRLKDKTVSELLQQKSGRKKALEIYWRSIEEGRRWSWGLTSCLESCGCTARQGPWPVALFISVCHWTIDQRKRRSQCILSSEKTKVAFQMQRIF